MLIRHYCSMAKDPGSRNQRRQRRLFLKQWRTYRNLTQEALADRVGMSVSNISQLERGLQGYSMDGLEALADALMCDPGQLLNVDPTDENGIWSLWERAQPGERQVIMDVAKGLVTKRAS